MFMRTAVLALGVSAVVASPVYKRQENITDSAVASGTSTDLASVATDTASAASSASSAISSIVESASSGTSTAPEPTATSTQPGNETETFTGCPDNYSLTYAIGINTYPDIEITAAYNALENWGSAVPPPIEAVSAEGEGVGATREWTLNGINASETLVNVTQDEATGMLDQQWNLTQPLNVSESLVISNATSALTLYSNSTTNETTVQLFVNFCVSDQPAGLELYGQLVSGYLVGLNSVFLNATGNSTDGGVGGATSSVPESTAEPTSTAESTTGPVDSASSAAEGVTGSAESGASGVAATITSGAGGALSTAVGGVTGAAETAISGVTSIFGQATGIIPTRRV